MKMKITFKEKEYEIPERIGLLPYRRYVNILNLKVPENLDNTIIYEYNLKYLSIVLDEPISYLENIPFEEFVDLLGSVNTAMIGDVNKDNVQNEINKPE